MASTAAQADGEPPGCLKGVGGWVINCGGGNSSGSGGAPTPGGGGSSGLPTPSIDLAEPSSQDGKACYVIVAMTLVGLTPGEIAGMEAASQLTETSMPACPNQDGGGAVPPPRVIAKDFWDTIPLPVPKPTSRPDYAVTGKTTYLSAGDTNDPAPWTRQTPYGLLTITAHGTYYVEWGDGTPTSGPYANAGGPYPSGDITHTYDDVGTVTIRVVEDWTATWTIGSLQGTLGGLQTTGTIAGFDVKQIQSVVTGSQ